jgi:hypothetical protein
MVPPSAQLQRATALHAAPCFLVLLSPRRAVLLVEETERDDALPAFLQPMAKAIQRASNDEDDDEEQKKKRRALRVTRILRADQLIRRNIGTKSTRRSNRSLKRNLPPLLTTKGGGKTVGSRLYSYMRKFGGAGMQGYHKDLGARPRIVHRILVKLARDRPRKNKPPKFVMVSIDPSLLPQGSVLNLDDPAVRRQVLTGNRSGYGRMYDAHRDEGVVVIDGDVPREAIIAIRAFRGVQSEEDIEGMLEDLVASEDEDNEEGSLPDEPQPRGFFRKDQDDPPPGGGLVV